MLNSRNVVLVEGNCQAGQLCAELAATPALQQHFTFQAVLSHRPELNDANRVRELTAHCDFFLQQIGGHRAANFVSCADSLPARCRRLKFPSFSLNFLWPLYVRDPENKFDQPGYPNGRYFYGDKLVIRLRQQGVPADEIARRYFETDIRTLVNLDALAEMSFEQQERLDQQCHFRLHSFLRDEFRHQRLFATPIHPTDFLTGVMSHSVSAHFHRLLGAPEPTPAPRVGNNTGDIELPLHPTVIEHFGIQWVNRDTRYTYMDCEFSCEEYIEHYAHFAECRMQPPARRFAFPDRTVGTVSRRAWGSLGTAWNDQVPASGEVEVAEGSDARLTLLPEALEWLPQLALRDAEDVQLLEFPAVPLRDHELTWLYPLTGLKHLDLSGTNTTDAGLLHMEAWPRLRKLVLPPQVTDAALLEFRRSRPMCHVFRAAAK